MPSSPSPSAAIRQTIAALAQPPRIGTLAPIAAEFVRALRLVALCDRAGRDPMPELAARLGGVEIAARALLLSKAIAGSWPEAILVARPCCSLLSHDEATVGAMVGAAARGDRSGFEAAISGLIPRESTHPLLEATLAFLKASSRAA